MFLLFEVTQVTSPRTLCLAHVSTVTTGHLDMSLFLCTVVQLGKKISDWMESRTVYWDYPPPHSSCNFLPCQGWIRSLEGQGGICFFPQLSRGSIEESQETPPPPQHPTPSVEDGSSEVALMESSI